MHSTFLVVTVAFPFIIILKEIWVRVRVRVNQSVFSLFEYKVDRSARRIYAPCKNLILIVSRPVPEVPLARAKPLLGNGRVCLGHGRDGGGSDDGDVRLDFENCKETVFIESRSSKVPTVLVVFVDWSSILSSNTKLYVLSAAKPPAWTHPDQPNYPGPVRKSIAGPPLHYIPSDAQMCGSQRRSGPSCP